LERLAAYVLAAQKVRGPVELAVDITGHKRIQALNRRYRGVDRTTDVISFRDEISPHPGLRPTLSLKGEGRNAPSPFREKVAGGRMRGLQGDLAINVHQAALQAKKMRHSLKREMRLLLIHGILHLLGFTDYEPAPRRRMFKRQNAILRNWETKNR
jgi:probable rRNA maturation factor